MLFCCCGCANVFGSTIDICCLLGVVSVVGGCFLVGGFRCGPNAGNSQNRNALAKSDSSHLLRTWRFFVCCFNRRFTDHNGCLTTMLSACFSLFKIRVSCESVARKLTVAKLHRTIFTIVLVRLILAHALSPSPFCRLFDFCVLVASTVLVPLW